MTDTLCFSKIKENDSLGNIFYALFKILLNFSLAHSFFLFQPYKFLKKTCNL